MMKRVFIFLLLIAAGVPTLYGQTGYSATARKFSVTVGGMGSIFQPDFAGDNNWVCTEYCGTSNAVYSPAAGASNQPLFGLGAFVDVKFSHWVQIEGEGRWLRFNQYEGIRQDNYLIGPRVPLYQHGKSTVYGKALIGESKMRFDTFNTHGHFTTIAFGGGVDYRLTKKISARADGEYQYWPSWGSSSISPYGASLGISYKLF